MPDAAGGSFGSKLFADKVTAIAGMCSRKRPGRPVKYMEDRVDNITNCDHHGSDRFYDVELAVDARRHACAASRSTSSTTTAPTSSSASATTATRSRRSSGPYRIRASSTGVRAVLTNKCQQGAYRGFGSEVNNWMLERMVDKAARRARPRPGRDPPRELHPARGVPVLHPDRQRLRLRRLRGRARQGARAARLRPLAARAGGGCARRGATSASASSPARSAASSAPPSSGSGSTSRARADDLARERRRSRSTRPARSRSRCTAPFWGNSPETMVAQLVAEEFGIEPTTSRRLRRHRTRLPGTGPGGSRITVMSPARSRAPPRKIKDKPSGSPRTCSRPTPDDLEWADGGPGPRARRSRAKSLAEIALMPHLFKHSLPEAWTSGLEATLPYDHPYTTMPRADRKDLGVFYPIMGHACHIAGGRGRRRDRAGHASSTTSPCTTAARWSTRGRSRGHIAGGIARASAWRSTRSSSTTTTASC